MHETSNQERDLVMKCAVELCHRAGFSDPSTMVQRDFEFLSDSIEEKTKVLISLSTIKRLLNGQFSRIPQVATLNAIANYLDYANWQDYRRDKTPSKPQSQEIEAPVPSQAKTVSHQHNYRKAILFGSILVLVALGLLAMLKMDKKHPGNFDKAKFSAIKTTSNDLPNSVVFTYDVSKVDADSFFIQQSWDRNRRVRIDKNSHTLTDIYYEPGYHVAKLIANDQVIRTQDVSIPTDRWFFYAKERLPRSETKYIHTNTAFNNGSLQFSKEDAINSQVEIGKDHDYVQVYFPSEIRYSSDNYTLKCRVRMTPVNNVHCPALMYEVFCQRNFMFFISKPKGCTSEIKAQYGDNFLNGKTNDLSSLGADVTEWQDVEVRVRNKQVSIFLNNKEVFTTSYKESGGLITGLGFISNGLCEVDNVDFRAGDGSIIYENSFDK